MCHRGHSDGQRLGRRQHGGRQIDGLHLYLLGHRRAVAQIDPFEPGGAEQELQRLGMYRTHMGEIADVAAEEGEPARRIDGLDHDRRAGAQLPRGGIKQAQQIRRLEMLDHLRGNHAADRLVGAALQIRERVAGRDVEAAFARDRRHLRIRVHARGLDAGGLQRGKKLTASAAEIDDRGHPVEDRHVGAYARLDALGGAAELVLEREVRRA